MGLIPRKYIHCTILLNIINITKIEGLICALHLKVNAHHLNVIAVLYFLQNVPSMWRSILTPLPIWLGTIGILKYRRF